MNEQKNRYLAPEGYFENTKDATPRSLLIEAIEFLPQSKSILVLDIGCGAGRDTRYFLEKGYKVEAVDGNQDSQIYLDALPHQENLKFVHSMIQDYEFRKYNLINASYILQFLDKNNFDEVIDRIKKSLIPGGVFVGQFLGVNDEWNKSGESMTFLTKDQTLAVLEGLETVYFDEKEEDNKTASGRDKHWHVFDIIARKPVLTA